MVPPIRSGHLTHRTGGEGRDDHQGIDRPVEVAPGRKRKAPRRRPPGCGPTRRVADWSMVGSGWRSDRTVSTLGRGGDFDDPRWASKPDHGALRVWWRTWCGATGRVGRRRGLALDVRNHRRTRSAMWSPSQLKSCRRQPHAAPRRGCAGASAAKPSVERGAEPGAPTGQTYRRACAGSGLRSHTMHSRDGADRHDRQRGRAMAHESVGIVDVRSPYPVAATMDRLEALVRARGLLVFGA